MVTFGHNAAYGFSPIRLEQSVTMSASAACGALHVKQVKRDVAKYEYELWVVGGREGGPSSYIPFEPEYAKTGRGCLLLKILAPKRIILVNNIFLFCKLVQESCNYGLWPVITYPETYVYKKATSYTSWWKTIFLTVNFFCCNSAHSRGT